MLVLVLALCSLAFSQFHVLQGNSHRQQAENLARSALSRALDKLLTDPTLGRYAGAGLTPNRPSQPDPALTYTAHFDDGSPADWMGWVTFDRNCGRPYSTNLLYGTTAVQGWRDHTVAPSTVHLVAEGKAGESTSVVEAVVSLPSAPTLATQGRLLSLGGLTVSSLTGPEQLADFVADRKVARLPADLVSNDGHEDSIQLGPETLIRGDVRTVGKLKLPPVLGTARILGGVFESSKVTRLININLDDFDPQAGGRAFTELTTLPSNPTVSGRARYNGILNIVGDLNLSGGLLYVTGDVNISGGIKGKGALVSRGNVQVEAGCNLNAGHSVALLTQGDVSLRGTDKLANSFQGLVYCGGVLRANQITLVGQLQARGTGDSTLNRCDVVGVPQKFTIPIQNDTPQLVWGRVFDPNIPNLQVKWEFSRNPDNSKKFQTARMGWRYYDPANGSTSWRNLHRIPTEEYDIDQPALSDQLWDGFFTRLCAHNVGSTFGMRTQLNPDGTFDLEVQRGGVMVRVPNYGRTDLLTDVQRAMQGEELVIFDPSKFYRWEDDARISLMRVLR